MLSSDCVVSSGMLPVVVLGSEVVLCLSRWTLVLGMCFLIRSDAKVVNSSSFGLSVRTSEDWNPDVILVTLRSSFSVFVISVVEASFT